MILFMMNFLWVKCLLSPRLFGIRLYRQWKELPKYLHQLNCTELQKVMAGHFTRPTLFFRLSANTVTRVQFGIRAIPDTQIYPDHISIFP